ENPLRARARRAADGGGSGPGGDTAGRRARHSGGRGRVVESERGRGPGGVAVTGVPPVAFSTRIGLTNQPFRLHPTGHGSNPSRCGPGRLPLPDPDRPAGPLGHAGRGAAVRLAGGAADRNLGGGGRRGGGAVRRTSRVLAIGAFRATLRRISSSRVGSGDRRSDRGGGGRSGAYRG